MKRFWQEVGIGPGGVVALDGRPVRTPGRTSLALPTLALAEAVAEEWRSVGETLDPRAMPLTGLANAAIDRIAPDPATFATGLARYAESDLVCYRADGPEPLVQRQSAAWQPPLDWVESRYDIALLVTHGIMPVAQPTATTARLTRVVGALTPFMLAGLSPLVTTTGSLIIGLGLIEGAITADDAWETAIVDETWQAELWGEDDLALQARAARREEFDAGVRFIDMLQDHRHFTRD